MNFDFLQAAAQIVQHHPIVSIGGAVVGAVVLWKGAKAALRRINAHLQNEAKLDAMEARLPKITRFVPPEQPRR